LYSANLLLLAVPLSGDGGVTASELFPQSADLKGAWHRMALLWRSQFPPEGFTALVERIDARREWNGDARELRIVRRTPAAALPLAPTWPYNSPPASRKQNQHGWREWFGWRIRAVDALRRQERFLCGHDEDVLLHAVEPLVSSIPDALVGFGGYWPDWAPSAAHTLLTLLLIPPDEDPSRLLAAYHDCLAVYAIAFGPSEQVTKTSLGSIILHHLAADLHRLPAAAVTDMLAEIQSGIAHNSDILTSFRELASTILSEEIWKQTPLARSGDGGIAE